MRVPVFSAIVSNIAFKRDAKLVKEYANATLTRAQFDSYKGQMTLRKKFGAHDAIYREYFGFGTTREMSQVCVMNDVLSELAKRKVTFNIEKQVGDKAAEQQVCDEGLFRKLEWAANSCLAQGNWPRIVAPYKELPRLISAVRQLRQERHLPPLERVL